MGGRGEMGWGRDGAGGGRWVWAQSGWQGTETGMEWVAGSDRGSGPSWGWQQAAQWMKAGQVMCGWGGGTLLLLKQMPWLLGLISPAKHHLPALAKNKLKHLWSVSVFLFTSMQRRSAFWLSSRLRHEPPETWAITVKYSAPSIFSLLLPIASLFHTPFSVFLHPSSWHFTTCFPLQQSRVLLQWNQERWWEGGEHKETVSSEERAA